MTGQNILYNLDTKPKVNISIYNTHMFQDPGFLPGGGEKILESVDGLNIRQLLLKFSHISSNI